MIDCDDGSALQAERRALIDATAVELRATRADARGRRRALARYFHRGSILGISTGELVDVLGVSSPSILTCAGYSDEEAQLAMDTVAELSDAEIRNETAL